MCFIVCSLREIIYIIIVYVCYTEHSLSIDNDKFKRSFLFAKSKFTILLKKDLLGLTMLKIYNFHRTLFELY